MSLPPAPAASFASDNAAGVAPAVLEALTAANTTAALAYGADRWTEELTARFRALLDAPVEVLVCWGGTGANVVGLASLLHPWQAVVCAATAHIVVDECGSPTRFTGSMLLPVPSADGKLTPDALAPWLDWMGDEHHPQPKVVSISQATELGTVYSVDQVAALASAAHAADMFLHVDGARIANAIVSTDSDAVSMLRDTGVDVITFGATKNGAMYGDAVVYLRPDLAAQARFVRKQAAQLPSKARFISAQLLALLADGLWLEHARHANLMARRLADAVRDIDGVALVREPESNAVFVTLPAHRIATLQDWSFFWEWDYDASVVRWMTSFATTEHDVDLFVAGLRAVLSSRAG